MEKAEQGVQVRQVVLDRGAGDAPPALGLDGGTCLGDHGKVVLDGVCFV